MKLCQVTFYSHTSFALNVATTVAPYVGDACSWLLALLQNKYMLSQILNFSADLSPNMIAELSILQFAFSFRTQLATLQFLDNNSILNDRFITVLP